MSQAGTSVAVIRVRLSGLGTGAQSILSIADPHWVVDCKRGLLVHADTQKTRILPKQGVVFKNVQATIKLNQKRYRDRVLVYPGHEAGTCLVVNHLDVERYLESVVNGEFNSNWAEAAVEAQVIAARSYAVYQMVQARKDRKKLYDVESTQKDQVYLGLDVADERAEKIVKRTQGMVLSGATRMQPLKAYYHSSCGGSTLLPQEVWKGSGMNGGLKGRSRCGFCEGAPSMLWTHRMSYHDIQSRVLRGLSQAEPGKFHVPTALLDHPEQWVLMDFKTTALPNTITQPKKNNNLANKLAVISSAQAEESPEPSRVKDLILTFQNQAGKKILAIVDAYQARNWLDPSRLKSTWFSMRTSGRSIQFYGRGSGHGVGLCQWGAKRMGELKHSRDQILSRYYPGSKITRIW